MPITRSIPLLCPSKTRSIVWGERSRVRALTQPGSPQISPPQATADWRRATERALPWPLAAPMSARRQPSVQLYSGPGIVGLVQVLNATLLGSSCVGSNDGGSTGCGLEGQGGGTTVAARRESEGGS